MYIVTKVIERQLYVLSKTDVLKDAQELLVRDFLTDYLSEWKDMSAKGIDSIKTDILKKKEDCILKIGLNHAWYSGFNPEDDSDWNIIDTDSDSIMPLSNDTSEDAETELWEMIESYLSGTC